MDEKDILIKNLQKKVITLYYELFKLEDWRIRTLSFLESPIRSRERMTQIREELEIK